MHRQALIFAALILLATVMWTQRGRMNSLGLQSQPRVVLPKVVGESGPAANNVIRDTQRMDLSGEPSGPHVVNEAHRNDAPLLSDADYAAEVEDIRQRLGDRDGFTIHIQKPFVVVGDEPAHIVKSRCKSTIQWAVDRLKAEYFAHDPDHIITIWLFKDEASYRKHTKALFGDEPDTPFGYYSPGRQIMAMNIATGSGTLVHEIVHPFVAANFPDCPAWFNEGLGSLYEQCGERNGKIIGHANWRLPALQQTIRAERLPTFKDLCATSTAEFYGDGRGTNYAQARHLLYYLQEKNLLHRYYHAFHQNRKDDPTGYQTLKQMLQSEGEDMDTFQNDWEQWVLQLEYNS